MTKYLDTLYKNNPEHIWSLDASPLLDSINSGNAILTGSFVAMPTLVSGGGASVLIKDSVSISYPIAVNLSYTIELWFNNISDTESKIIVDSVNNGLYYEDSVISLRFNTPAGLLSANYLTNNKSARHVVGVITPERIYLYVDGVLRDDQEGIFTSPSGNFSSSGSFVLDSVSYYSYALTSAIVKEHFAAGRNVLSPAEVVSRFGGTMFDLTDQAADKYDVRVFNTTDEWNQGVYDGLTVDNGLRSIQVDDEYLAGQWNISVSPNSLETELTFATKIEYIGTGADVYYSLNNGETWSMVGSDLIAYDMSANEDIDISVNLRNEEAYVSYLRVTFYRTDILFNSRNIKITESIPGFAYYPIIEFNDNALEANILEITADIDDVGARALDMWIKSSGSGNFLSVSEGFSNAAPNVIITNQTFTPAGCQIWVNGVENALLVADAWNHVIIQFESYSGPLFINGGGNLELKINHLAIYENPVDALVLYKLYLGIVNTTIVDNSGIIFGDKPPKVYDFSWSITSGSY